MVILSKTERAYLNGEREFTKAQIRCIKSRLNKKVRLAEEELQNFYKNRNDCNTASEICNGQLPLKLRNTNKNGAGSGTFALPSRREAREGTISNPRVLSDMGLAIPRPTRLGDPRSFGMRFPLNIILTSLLEDMFSFISSLFEATFLQLAARFLLHAARYC